MTDTSKAVFLSYASQDAEAARRICDALRASGVEVWFDVEGGLEHGDEWDAKIRRQIKECVLFIPLVSANTQAREEGYFRIEWELAAQRALGIASGVAFILPVVIDDTREPEALVPDRFRAVQWTRLPGGVVPHDVQARFLKLWSHRTGVLKHEAVSGGPRTEDGERRTDGGADQSQSRKRNPAVMASAILALVAVAAIAVWQPWRSSDSDQLARPELVEQAPRSAPALGPSNGLPAPVPPSEARQLVERARGLMDKLNVLPADLNTAAGLLEQATKLAPNDALVWSTWALLDLRYVSLDYDNSPSRHNAARSHVAQANALDPASRETRYTQAEVMRSLSSDPATLAAAEQILRPMLTEAPEDGRVLIQLGWLVSSQGKRDDALALFDRAALLPAFAAQATYCKALVLIFSNQFEASEHAIDQLLALEPTRAIALCNKAWLSAAWHADLDAARDYLTQIPPQMRVEDMSAYFAYHVYLSRREYDQAVQAIRAVPRDYLSAQPGPGPSGFYNGDALAAAGKSAAAEIEWRRALATVERRLAEAPSDETLMKFKALLLARLGDRVAGERVWKTVIELYGDSAGGALAPALHVEFLPPDEAIAWLNARLREPQHWFTAAALRFHPVYDPLRSNPKFTALVEKMETDPRFSPKADQRTEVGRHTSDSDLPASRSPLLAPSRDKSIAVLPFANLSPDPENAFFCDGVHEDVITALAKIHDLKVISRTSVMTYKTGERNLKHIGAELGVAHVLEGSVRRAGNRVRVTAQLIDAQTDAHLWAETYTVDLTDVFTVQSELATAITTALKATLSPEEASLIGRRLTQNQQAYDLYLQGRAEAGRYVDRIAKLERAVALDPEFADALAWLSIWCSRAYWDEAEPTRAAVHRARALSALATAERLAPALPLVGVARADARYRIDRDFARAWEELRAVEAVAPNDSDLLQSLAYTARRLGRWSEALAYFERSRQLDPFNRGNRYLFHIQTLVLVRRLDEARSLLSETTARLGGFSPLTWQIRGIGPDIYEPAGGSGLSAAVPAPAQTQDLRWMLSYYAACHRLDWNEAARLLAEHARDNVPEPEFVIPVALLRAEMAFLSGDSALAVQQADLAITHFRDRPWPPRYEAWAQLGIARAEAWSGQGEDAVRRATEAMARMRREDAFDTALNLPKLGRILIAAGRREEAIGLLREMMASACGLTPQDVRRDALWSRLKDDPRFEEILERAKPL